jgi:hypothetical protein
VNVELRHSELGEHSARVMRSASARRFHTVHVDRWVATLATARAAIWATVRRSGRAVLAPGLAAAGTAAISCRTASRPKAAISEARQAERISVSERAGFLAVRVSRLAWRASWWQAEREGSWPCFRR